MVTLRCTGKLIKRLTVRPDSTRPVSTTLLGDWYANLIYLGRQQFVLCVCEKTLLPVLITAAGKTSVEARLRDGLAEVLHAIGVHEAAAQAELLEMATVVISTTASRTVLGSMNDFASMLSFDPPGRSLLERSLHIAAAPCSPIGMDSPRQATVDLFRKPRLRVVK